MTVVSNSVENWIKMKKFCLAENIFREILIWFVFAGKLSWKCGESMVYKTDLFKYHKTLFRETKRFAKNVKIIVQKITVSQNKIRCTFNKYFFIKEISYPWDIIFWLPRFATCWLRAINSFSLLVQIIDKRFRRNQIMVRNMTFRRTLDWSLCYKRRRKWPSFFSN